MSKKSQVEIDITLNDKNVKKDLQSMAKEAKKNAGTVVEAMDKATHSIEESGHETKQIGKEIEDTTRNAGENFEEMGESARQMGEDTSDSARSLEELRESTEKTNQSVERSQKSFINWGSAVKLAIAGVVTVAAIAFGAIAAGTGAATSFGIEYKKASNDIQAQTGATKEEMEGLSDAMKQVYADNFGEDMNDVAEAIATVKKNIGGTDDEIRQATEEAIAFRDTFGYEVPESTRAASALIKHFGVDAKTAYDLMAKGAQNGLDYSGELIDNIDEYSVQFAKAGLSANEMFNIMAAGYDAGSWNLDKIGDAVKELNIRLVDGSETTKAGLEAIGMNADEVAKKMSKGGETAKKTYKQVVDKLADMDDQQARNIAGVNLFGTMWEDLGPEVVAQLAVLEGAYDDASGTMDKINDVKYDDAQSALEALKRKTQVSLLLPISEDIMPAISGATDAAIGYIDQLADAYENHGVNGLLDEAGEVFAEISVKAAAEAPRMVEAAVDFVENTVDGLAAHKGELVDAGADMVKTLAGAAVKILPTELQRPVKEAVNDIVDSFTGGGIKKGTQTFGKIFENGFKVVSKVTKTVLPPFAKAVDKAADNMDTLIPLVVAGATAFKTYSVLSSVTSGLKSLTAVTATLTTMEKANTLRLAASTGALTAKEMVVGVLTGKITLATAATAAWNAVLNANPIALLVTGVVAAGAALVAYNLATGESKDKVGALSEEEEKLKNRVEEQADSYKRLKDAREEQMGKIGAEYANTQALADELSTIVDENGKIKKGYEERANVIVGILSNALGIEIDVTDGVIQKYGELKQTINEVIQTKKAEAIQSAMEDSYTDAIKKQTQAYQDYAQAQKNVEKTSKQLTDAQTKEKQAREKLIEASKEQGAAVIELNTEYQQAKSEVEALENKQKDQKDTLKESENTYLGYVATIQNYEGVVGAIASGEADQIDEAMRRAVNSFETAETGTEKSLKKQVQNMTDNYTALQDAVKSGAPGVTQNMVDEAAIMVAEATAEYAKVAPNASKEIAKLDPAVMSVLAQANLQGKLGNEGKKDLKALIDGLDGLDSKTRDKFEMAVEGALEGLEGFDEIKAKAEENGTSFLEALATTLEVHSPSAAVRRIFSQVNPGAQEGVEEGKNSLLEKGTSLAQEFLNSLTGGLASGKIQLTQVGQDTAESVKSGVESVDATRSGTLFGTQYATGVKATTGKNNIAANGVAKAAKTGIELIKALASGTAFGNQYATGIQGKRGSANSAGAALGSSAKSGAGYANPAPEGNTFGNRYTAGVRANTSGARNAGSGLSGAARSGLAVNGSTDIGRNFGQGFINGIGSMIGGAINAAANFAANALNAAKRALDSHSPSRKTDKLGSDFDQGFINAVTRRTADVMKAVGQMGKSAIDEFQTVIGDGFDIEELMGTANFVVQRQIDQYSSYRESGKNEDKRSNDAPRVKEINQTINIYQPVKSPIETSRALRREARRMAQQ